MCNPPLWTICIVLLSMHLLCIYLLVPPPTITVKHSGSMTVGRSLYLNCMVTTVRGITRRISVVWTSCDKKLYSTSITQGTTSNIRYRIHQLNTTDHGKVYQCEVVINTIPPVRATGQITLNVNSKLSAFHVSCALMYILKDRIKLK